MADSNDPKSFIKRKNKPEAVLGFRTSSFFRGQMFKAGGMKPGKAVFNPGNFKTQHKG